MEFLTNWTNWMLQRSELLPVFGIVFIITIMIIPIPTFLLDLLMAVNIFLSLMVLIMTMFIDNVLDFSIFPSLLLVTTLLRLSINISSTRLILLRGEAFDGRIIRTFGDFVVGGNYIVGFVIFIILLIVQLMIITKGSGRIAEVAARFTLDAMPGKQMSIDSDLQNGLLTEEEAKVKREDIKREADFYGSMDGASKFVQGDAIAGLIITGINILGGILIGVFMHGESIMGAMRIYSLFTIGDGIASQLPALLISVGAGIIVSRSASKENLGADIMQQFTNFWQPLAIAALVMIMLSLVPGMPKITFWTIGGVLSFLAYVRFYGGDIPIKDKESEEEEEQEKSEKEKTSESFIDNTYHVDKLELEIGIGLIVLVDASQGGDLKERITMLRREIALELGLMMPKVRIRDNIQLQPNNYKIKLKGMEAAAGEVLVDKYFALNTGFATEELAEGVKAKDPIYGSDAYWIEEEQKDYAENAGYTVVDASTIIITHMKEIVIEHAHELLGREELEMLVEYIKNDYKTLVDELIGDSGTKIKLSELQKILQNLLKESVSIRNLVMIFEALLEAKNFGIENLDQLTEYCRAALSRQIVEQYIDKNENTLNVVNLDPQLEKALLSKRAYSQTGIGYLSVSPNEANNVINALADLVVEIKDDVHSFVVLTSPDLRPFFKRLLEREKAFSKTPVLSYNEIPSNISIKAAGVLKA
ncbi:MAG: flagellar biosynthesis protein FlhA [Candidatus Muiribacteriota bacterium]